MKNKYSSFITEISEILGLRKPIDILKLCATTDLFFQPLEKRIEELEKEIKRLETELAITDNDREHNYYECLDLYKKVEELEKENAELKKVAEFQQSSNMSRHFENKKLKEVLTVGSIFNKALNSMNKSLEEERDKYRNMVFDKNDQLTKAGEIIKSLISTLELIDGEQIYELGEVKEAERFLNGEVKK